MGAGQLLYLGNHDDLVQGARSGTGEKRWLWETGSLGGNPYFTSSSDRLRSHNYATLDQNSGFRMPSVFAFCFIL